MALAAESARPPFRGWWKSKTHRAPLRVTANGVMRVAWRGGGSHVTPRADRAAAALAGLLAVRLLPSERIDNDYTRPTADDAAQEGLILELAEHGDVIGAVRAARRRYGMSIVDAKRFVEELRSQPDAAVRTAHPPVVASDRNRLEPQPPTGRCFCESKQNGRLCFVKHGRPCWWMTMLSSLLRSQARTQVCKMRSAVTTVFARRACSHG